MFYDSWQPPAYISDITHKQQLIETVGKRSECKDSEDELLFVTFGCKVDGCTDEQSDKGWTDGFACSGFAWSIIAVMLIAAACFHSIVHDCIACGWPFSFLR